MKNNNEIFAMTQKGVDGGLPAAGRMAELEASLQSLRSELKIVKEERDALQLQLISSKEKIKDMEETQQEVLIRLDKMESIILETFAKDL